MRIKKIMQVEYLAQSMRLKKTLQGGSVPVPCTQSRRHCITTPDLLHHRSRLVREAQGSQVSLSTHLC